MFDEEDYGGDDEDWEHKNFLEGMEEADEDELDEKKKKDGFSDDFNEFEDDFSA